MSDVKLWQRKLCGWWADHSVDWHGPRCDDRIGRRSGRRSATSTVSLHWRADAAAKPIQTKQGTLLTQPSQREGPSPVVQIYKEMQQTYIFHAGGDKCVPINRCSKILYGGAQNVVTWDMSGLVSSSRMDDKQIVGIFGTQSSLIAITLKPDGLGFWNE